MRVERGTAYGSGGSRIAAFPLVNLGADDGIRTRDPHLGKVVLYQLSHVRACPSILGARSETFNRLFGHPLPDEQIPVAGGSIHAGRAEPTFTTAALGQIVGPYRCH